VVKRRFNPYEIIDDSGGLSFVISVIVVVFVAAILYGTSSKEDGPQAH
jgi:hypothetical protein